MTLIFIISFNLRSLSAQHNELCSYLMYHSILSLTIPPGDPRGFAHSSCARGRVFAALSCPGFAPGVLNQSKSSIILKKARFLLCLLTLRAPRVLVPTPSTKGGGGRKGPPPPVSQEREMLQT